MAEWSGMGLQNLLRRFESVCDLDSAVKFYGNQSLEGAHFYALPSFFDDTEN
jgi:hypothetical protein